MARDAPGWHTSVKAVLVLRAAMAVVSVASVMVQVEDEATEPVREACHGEKKEGDPPPPSRPSAAQPRTTFLIRLASGA